MNLKDATNAQLHIMLNSFGDYTRHQEEGAAQFDGKTDALPEDMRDIPQRMRKHGAEADQMRNEVAGEMHIRGMTSCELAHPTHKTCPWGVNV